MDEVQDKVCCNHPDRAAVTRCENCFRPLCEDCVLVRAGMEFCSETCHETMEEVARNISSFEARRKRELMLRRKRRLTRFLVLILVIGALLTYALTHRQQMVIWRDWLLQHLPDLSWWPWIKGTR